MADRHTSEIRTSFPEAPASGDGLAEDRFRVLSEAAFEAILLSEHGTIVDANSRAAELFGYEAPGDLVGRHAAELVAPEYAGVVDDAIRQERTERYDAVLQRRDGTHVPVEIQARLIDVDGRRLRVTALRDVTERRRAERAIQASEERYRSLVEDQPELVCRFLPDGTLTFINQAYARYFERDAEALDGLNFFDLLPDHEKARMRAYLDDFAPERPVATIEHEVVLPDGSARWQEWTDRAFFDAEGHLVEFQSIGRDVSERKQAEQQLAREKVFVELLQEVAVAANEALTSGAALQFAVDRICEFTGWPVGHVYRVRREGGQTDLYPTGIWHLEEPARFERFRAVTEATTFDEDDGLPGRVLATGRPAWIHDVMQDAAFTRARLVEDLGVRAGFAFPVSIDRDVVAVLEFYAETQAEPDDQLLDIMSNIGRQLGHVIERKQTAEALRTSEERYRTLTQYAVVAIITTDDEGRLLDWNRRAEKIFGYRSEEVLGRSIEMLMPARYVGAHQEGMKRMRAGGPKHVIGQTVELHGVRKSGEEFPIELALSEWRAGGHTFYTGFIHDITARKHTEEALRRSEAQNRAIIDALPDALVRIGADGVYREVRLPRDYTPVADPEALAGKQVDEVLPPEVARRARAAIDDALATGDVQTFEYEIETGGGVRIREARVVPSGDDEVISVQRDVTERVRAEQQVEALNRRLQLILDSAGEGIYGLDVDGRTTFVNEAAARMLGYTPEELIGQPQHGVIHHSHADGTPYPREDCPIYAAFADGAVHHVTDEVFWRKDGTSFQVEYVSTPLLEDGEVNGAVVLFRDVTERRQAEAAVRESARQLARAQEIAHLGSWEWNIETGALNWSDELYRIYGLDPEGEPITYETYTALQHPEDRPAIEATIAASMETGEPFSFYHRIVRPDGTERIVRGDGEVVMNAEGQPVRMLGTAHDVTEMKQAEQELRASEGRYRMLAENVSDLIVRSDAQGLVTYVSPSAQRLFGYAPEELVGESGYTRIHPADIPHVEAAHAALFDDDTPVTVQYQYRCADGRYVWVETTARPVFGDDGALAEIVSITRDISERIAAQKALERSEQLLSGVLGASLDGVMALEAVRTHEGELADFRWLLLNPAAAAVLQRPVEELMGKRLLLEYPNVREIGLFDAYARVVETGEPFNTELYYDDDGITGWFALTAVKLGDGLTVTFQDITARKVSEAQLERSEDLLNRAQRIARIGSWEWDVRQNALYWSEELYRIFGLDSAAEEITFGSYIGRIHEDDRERVQSLIAESAETYEPFSFYHKIVRDDGEERIVRGDGEVILDEAGDILKMYGTAHDVTERRKAEERLRLLEASVFASVDGITICDATAGDLPVVFASPSFTAMTGYTLDEVLGRNMRILQGRERDQAAVREIKDAITAGREVRVVLRNYRKDGALFWNELTLYPLKDATGQLTHYVGIQRDVTERRQAQEQLERFNVKLEQRNRELQDFAYVASHDLQEPLRKIRAFADLMREDYAGDVDETGQYYLERMQDAAGRMSDLIADLLAYSRVTTRAKPFERVDLNQIIADVLSDLELQISEVEGTVDVADLPTLEADPTQMRQILQNLIGNALKFHRAEERPVVKVWARQETSDEFSKEPQPIVRIFVQDNGIGFKEKYLDRIFTPFQRLHNRGEYKGTGMGLAICRRIAERHQGAITARSAPGEGATFIISLPLAQPEPPSDKDPDA